MSFLGLITHCCALIWMQISWGDEWSKVCSSSKLLSWHLHFPNFMSMLLNRLLSPFGSDSTWLVVVLQSRLWLLVCTHSHTNQKERKKEKKNLLRLSARQMKWDLSLWQLQGKREVRESTTEREKEQAGDEKREQVSVCVNTGVTQLHFVCFLCPLMPQDLLPLPRFCKTLFQPSKERSRSVSSLLLC